MPDADDARFDADFDADFDGGDGSRDKQQHARRDKISDMLGEAARRARRSTRRRGSVLHRLPRYDVTLEAADRARVDELIDALTALTPLTPRTAMDAVMLAHAGGSARLLTAHLEAAEFHHERLRAAGLRVCIRRVA
ncbi:MAG: hypothetical protein AAGK04_13755 [Planctomycetota bacterium]